MTGHDVTQAMLAGVIALELWHLRLHDKITRDLATLKSNVRTLLNNRPR